MKTAQPHRDRLEAQLAIWRSQLDVVKARAELAGAYLKADLMAQIAKLEMLNAAGHRHVALAGVTASPAWNDIHAVLTANWNRANRAIDALWPAAAIAA